MRKSKPSPENKRFFESVKRAMPAAAQAREKNCKDVRHTNLHLGKRKSCCQEALRDSNSLVSTRYPPTAVRADHGDEHVAVLYACVAVRVEEVIERLTAHPRGK